MSWVQGTRGGFDRIGAEGSFVDGVWALSLVYFGCTETVFTDSTRLGPEGTPLLLEIFKVGGALEEGSVFSLRVLCRGV